MRPTQSNKPTLSLPIDQALDRAIRAHVKRSHLKRSDLVRMILRSFYRLGTIPVEVPK